MRRGLLGLVCGIVMVLIPFAALAQTDEPTPEPADPAPATEPVEYVPRYHTVAEGESLFFFSIPTV